MTTPTSCYSDPHLAKFSPHESHLLLRELQCLKITAIFSCPHGCVVNRRLLRDAGLNTLRYQLAHVIENTARHYGTVPFVWLNGVGTTSKIFSTLLGELRSNSPHREQVAEDWVTVNL